MSTAETANKVAEVNPDTCALCGTTPARGKTLKIRTGEWLRSNAAGTNQTVHTYGNFKMHAYLICDACQRKRRRQKVLLIVGYVLFFVFMCVATPGVVWLTQGPARLAASFQSLMLVPVMATFVFVVVTAIAFWGSAPENKFQGVALKDRMRAEGVSVNKYRTF